MTHEASILKNTSKKTNKIKTTFITNAICNDCFDSNNYVNFVNTNDCITKNFSLFTNDKKIYILKKDWTKYFKREKRKEKLNKKLRELKLPYLKNSVCTLYINNGKPDLDTVIKLIHKKQKIQTKRLYRLLKKLQKNNLEYDSNIPSYKKFIEKGGDIKKIIENAEVEKVLINSTNYLSILNLADSETAREVSVNDYVLNNKKSNKAIDNFISNKNAISFE